MHPYLFVPFAATIVGSAIAAATLARAPTHPASKISAGLIGLTALWGLFDFMAAASTDADSAVLWRRAAGPAVLALGPVCLLLLATLKPQFTRSMGRLAWFGFALAVPLAFLCLFTPLVFGRAMPSLLTIWRFEPGPLFIWFVLQASALPMLTIVAITLDRRRPMHNDTPHSNLILGLAISVPLGCTIATEAALPLLGIDFPRVGPLSVSLLGGLIWLSYFSGFDGAISEAGLARRILESLPTGVALMEVDGRLRIVNQPLARWMGVEREELIGRSASSLLLMPLPELLGLEEERETELLPEGGEAIPVAVSVDRIRDRQGGDVGFVVTCRDLREQADLESHLDMADQMATVGEMAAGIAHEVNNPVAYIQANLNLMRRHYQALAKLLETAESVPACTPEFVESGADRVEDALGALSKVSRIVREVRAFAHAGQGERQLTDVNEVLESALRLAALNREDDGPVEQTFAELPRIEAGGQDLKQAFFGLAQWAFSRVDRSEKVDVGTALVDERVQVVFELRAGQGRELADRGRRMATSSIQLVIARQIIEQQGGTLEVEDLEGGFTRIRAVLFPETPETPEPETEPETEGVTGRDSKSGERGGAEAAGSEGDAR